MDLADVSAPAVPVNPPLHGSSLYKIGSDRIVAVVNLKCTYALLLTYLSVVFLQYMYVITQADSEDSVLVCINYTECVPR